MPESYVWLIILGAFVTCMIAANSAKNSGGQNNSSNADNNGASLKKPVNHEGSGNERDNNAIGTIFENRIAELFEKDSTLRSWKMLRNVELYDSNKKKTEIDIVLLSGSGIFVIECKCWGGTLIANDDWNYWVQIDDSFKSSHLDYDFKKKMLLTDNHIKALESPILQNKQHVDKLKQYLNNGTDKAIKQFKQITVLSEKSNKDRLCISKFNEQKKTEYTDGIIAQDYYTWIGTENKICEALKSYPICASPVPIDEIYNKLLPCCRKTNAA